METFKWCGYNWRIGHLWGRSHPQQPLNWYGDDSVRVNADGELILDIVQNAKEFDGVVKPYSVGVVDSVEEFRYGIFKWECKQPVGTNLWSALWLTGVQTWPPEIDCMEGWSSPKKPTFVKRLFWLNIKPTMHWGTPDDHKSQGKHNIWRWWINERKFNRYMVIWTKEYVKIFYNSHLVKTFDDRDMLREFNKEGVTMTAIMSMNQCDGFTNSDFVRYVSFNQPMVVRNFEYTPIEY